jgi:hypothetical protein
MLPSFGSTLSSSSPEIIKIESSATSGTPALFCHPSPILVAHFKMGVSGVSTVVIYSAACTPDGSNTISKTVKNKKILEYAFIMKTSLFFTQEKSIPKEGI